MKTCRLSLLLVPVLPYSTGTNVIAQCFYTSTGVGDSSAGSAGVILQFMEEEDDDKEGED